MITVFSPSFGFFPLSRDFALALIRQTVIKRIPCFEAKKKELMVYSFEETDRGFELEEVMI